jgi:hypothetical protein
MQELIGKTAGILSFAAYALYILTTIAPGKFFGQTTRPNRATWWILTLVGGLIAESYYCSGAKTTMWVAASYFVGPLLISIISLHPKLGVGGWTGTDKWCLLCAVICLWFRMTFPDYPKISLALSLTTDLFGLWPTIKKSYLTAESEDKYAWTLETGACFINMFAINSLSWEIWLQPLYLFVINATILALLVWNGLCQRIIKKFNNILVFSRNKG